MSASYAYVARYREALRTIFVPDKLQRRVDELAAFIHDQASSSDQLQLDASADAIKRYLRDRYQSVADELARY